MGGRPSYTELILLEFDSIGHGDIIQLGAVFAHKVCIIEVMNIYAFGNPDVEMDSLPLRLLPALQRDFPAITFTVEDPNEEWDIRIDAMNGSKIELIILDTAVGIGEVTIFNSLESFAAVPRIGMHDFDALTNLRFMKKLGKIDKVTIIAVPPEMDEKAALEAVSKAIGKL